MLDEQPEPSECWTYTYAVMRSGLDTNLLLVLISELTKVCCLLLVPQEDKQRVSQLFVDAAQAGIPIQQRSLGSVELQVRTKAATGRKSRQGPDAPTM